jgi:hypothetical protein
MIYVFSTLFCILGFFLGAVFMQRKIEDALGCAMDSGNLLLKVDGDWEGDKSAFQDIGEIILHKAAELLERDEKAKG